ncbi:hypothetical protein MMC21_006800 [Puttea exsequens]|nr:hypothetical protein [Puttea exsequens]
MAHTTAITSTVEKLIHTITETSLDSNLQISKDLALTEFAKPHYARTNPFDVNARLEGLVEKAEVLNNDPLADALKVRLQEISKRDDKWIPELLSLLLHLSDRPVENTRVDDLVLLEPEPSTLPLTWSDVVADDPLNDLDGIWTNVDFSADASDGGSIVEGDRSIVLEETPGSSLPDFENSEAKPEDLVLEDNVSGRWQIEATMTWKRALIAGSASEHWLTECQVAREAIFMMLGLPNSISMLSSDGGVSVNPHLCVRHVSQSSLENILHDFVLIAKPLTSLREWTKSESTVPLHQTLQAVLTSRLKDLETHLDEIQAALLNLSGPMVSLMQIYSDIQHYSRLVFQFHDILSSTRSITESEWPFKLLEALYDKTCDNQSIGDEEGFEYMARIFFECFQTYLRSLRLWMEKGQLSRQDQTMFIKERTEAVPLQSLWQCAFELWFEHDHLRAPKFLYVATGRIFNTGKSVDFLRNLGYDIDGIDINSVHGSELTLESVCHSEGTAMLSPFSELFHLAFDRWVSSKYQTSSSTLRRLLDTNCGLQRSMDALEAVFFSRNGAISGSLGLKIFERIDSGHRRWMHSSILTELFKEAFDESPCVAIDRIEVRWSVTSTFCNARGVGWSMKALEDLRLSYKLSWPVANIIRPESEEMYQHVFVFLAQLQRAKYLLRRQKLPICSFVLDANVLSLTYKLHQRLLWFTNILLMYLFDMVLLTQTAEMRVNMSAAEDIDAMVTVHEGYTARVKERSFLTAEQGPIRQAIVSILELTVIFADMQASSFQQSYSHAENSAEGSKESRRSTPKQKGKRRGLDIQVGSDNDGEDPELDASRDALDADRLGDMCDTFRKLHSFVTSSVQALSRADGATCWEVLASNLAAGLE